MAKALLSLSIVALIAARVEQIHAELSEGYSALAVSDSGSPGNDR